MINIRKVAEKDAYDYETILNQSWKDTYGGYISFEHIDDEFNIDKLIAGFPEHLKRTGVELYMLEYDGKTVGIMELGEPDENYKEDMTGIGEGRTIHIKKEYQNLGIGSTAEKFMYNRLKELGYTKVCVWIKKKNTKSIAFHKKRGFVETNYTCENPADGAPSFIMERDYL